MNTQHQAGYDAAGNPGGPVFSYDPNDVLGSLTVAITDPQKVAASSVPGGGLDGGNADALGTAPGVSDSYQKLVTGLGTTVAGVPAPRRRPSRCSPARSTAPSQQLGGVDLDEEMVNMLAAQHAYEAASRVMTTVDSMLDTLINRTGVTH